MTGSIRTSDKVNALLVKNKTWQSLIAERSADGNITDERLTFDILKEDVIVFEQEISDDSVKTQTIQVKVGSSKKTETSKKKEEISLKEVKPKKPV
jgi:hypothetical protein